jgi:hypothetical protein
MNKLKVGIGEVILRTDCPHWLRLKADSFDAIFLNLRYIINASLLPGIFWRKLCAKTLLFAVFALLTNSS